MSDHLPNFSRAFFVEMCGKKREKVSRYTSYVHWLLLSALQQKRAQARLLYSLNNSCKSPWLLNHYWIHCHKNISFVNKEVYFFFFNNKEILRGVQILKKTRQKKCSPFCVDFWHWLLRGVSHKYSTAFWAALLVILRGDLSTICLLLSGKSILFLPSFLDHYKLWSLRFALSFNFDPLVEDIMLQLSHYTLTSTQRRQNAKKENSTKDNIERHKW